MPEFVEVVFPLPIDTTFTYILPDEALGVEVGSRVLAPFRKRLMTGYVVGMHAEAGEIKCKPIEALLDTQPLLSPELISLARMMAKQYGASFGEAIQTLMPPGLVRQTRRRIISTSSEGTPTSKEAAEFLERIRNSEGLDFVTTVRRNPKSVGWIREFEKAGWVTVLSVLRKERAKVPKRKSEKSDGTFDHAPEVELNSEQTYAIDELTKSLDRRKFESFLLHGITGSGKTEIYLNVAQKAIADGRKVLALVPEISLTPQFVGRFRARFGDAIAVLHSARSEGERLVEWQRIRRGEASIVIGARSAVFAPLTNIGLVIVDEEHDSSYKQHEGLLYHARDLARHRAEETGATFLLGSATPALETFHVARQGNIRLLSLTSRATGQGLPLVEIVDLKKQITASGSKGIFSEELKTALENTLTKGEQAVLFLNRRGFAPTVFCPTCGQGLRCRQCSVSLALHKKDGLLLCHYCGYSSPTDSPCNGCGQSTLIPMGIGTERVERELRDSFPDARVARMDRDTVMKRGEHEKILREFALGKTEILIGTQMVTKGIDFPKVTLVGVLLADQSLHFPDFRSAERTFQLLTQVVGRSGRGEAIGKAVIQTFQPEHYAVKAGAGQDYIGFFDKEIVFRKELNYPPFSSLSLIELTGKDYNQVRKGAVWLGRQIAKHGEGKDLDVLGPAPAPVVKVEGKTRYHLLLRSKRGPMSGQFAKWLVAQSLKPLREQGVDVKVDIDPYHFI